MSKTKYEKILSRLAWTQGIRAEEIEKDLQRDLEEVFDSMEEQMQKEWSKIEFQGKRPVVEIFITNILARMQQFHS